MGEHGGHGGGHAESHGSKESGAAFKFLTEPLKKASKEVSTVLGMALAGSIAIPALLVGGLGIALPAYFALHAGILSGSAFIAGRLADQADGKKSKKAGGGGGH